MVLSLLMDVLLTRHTGSLCSVTQVGPYAPLYEYYLDCVICAGVFPCQNKTKKKVLKSWDLFNPTMTECVSEPEVTEGLRKIIESFDPTVTVCVPEPAVIEGDLELYT